MPPAVRDTSTEAEQAQLRVLRDLGAEQRSRLAAQWSDEVREISLQGIRDRHRNFDDRRVTLEYARITLGEGLFREAFAKEALELE